jgi:hypothetical protein
MATEFNLSWRKAMRRAYFLLVMMVPFIFGFSALSWAADDAAGAQGNEGSVVKKHVDTSTTVIGNIHKRPPPPKTPATPEAAKAGAGAAPQENPNPKGYDPD